MMRTDRTSLEGAGFVALWASLLSVILGQGLWRPLVHALGSPGHAEAVTGAALTLTLATVLTERLQAGRAPWLPVTLSAVCAAGAAGALSLGVAGLLTLLAVAAAVGALVAWMPTRLPPVIDGMASRHRGLAGLYVVLALVSVVMMARLSIFVGDPTRVDQQMLPGNSFVETHSCLTAYVRADALVRSGTHNVYDDAWWAGSNGLPPRPVGVEDPYRPFDLDNFSYPPPFLLFVAPLVPFEGDFLAQRALWFGLDGLLLALALWIVARWIDGPRAHRALLLAPLFLGSLPVLVTLQIGNFHLAAMALSVLSMVAHERGRSATGGALLAAAILAKISPGILALVLLVQRHFRIAAAAAGFGLLLLALSVLRDGTDPIRSFVTYALPRLASGHAFPFMDTESGVVTNMSPFGIAFKLRLLGVDLGDPWRLGAWIGRAYTFFVVTVAVVCARRRGDRREQAIRWMSLLVLAALQSPFSPGYATLALLWATTLLSVEVGRARDALAVVGLWIVALLPPGSSVALSAVQSAGQTVIVIGVATWLSLRVRPVGEGA